MKLTGGLLVVILALATQAVGQERRDADPNSTTTSQTNGTGTTSGTSTTRTGVDGTRDNRDAPGFNPGWLGLLGLAGLAGLMPKNRHEDRVHTDHNMKR